MTRNITFAEGEYYHVYNRGTEKRTIFLSLSDYERFVALLYLCNSSIAVDLKLQGSTLEKVVEIERGAAIVDLCAYCLMPNHFHLLLRERTEGGLSRFMQKLVTAYTMYFNKKNERTGALFQGKFKAEHAGRDEYLKYLISYIHLNPVKLIDPAWKEQGIKDLRKTERYLESYAYSSYPDFISPDRLQRKVLAADSLPEYFSTPRDFRLVVEDWLSCSKEELQGRTLLKQGSTL